MLTPTGASSYTYTWTVPTGVETSTSNTVTTTKVGNYSLTITDANSCTSEVGAGTVTVNPLPTVTITNPAAVCAPSTVDLTASTITAGSTASLTYTYYTNATATSSLTNTTLIGSSGTYYIKGTTASNCSAINAVIISINAVPTFNVTSPSVCLGTSLKVTANPLTGVSTDYDYTWIVPTGVTNPGNVPSFTTTTAGVYTATIKNKTTNCTSAPVNNSVSFYPLPIAAAIVAPDNKVIVNNTLNLTASASGGSSPYNFTWSPNSTINYTISGQENAVFTALKEGKVKFKYQVKDANNCEVSSAEYEITIDPADIILVLPNAFTPNGDNNNDEFKVVASNTLGKTSFKSLEIYNRNGKLMFRTEDITKGWNGRSGDVLQDMGVYFAKLVKLNKDGQLVVETSPIYLLK
jgi:gliding motility-associated-like protein